MKSKFYTILLKLFGWEIIGQPIGEKSVCVVAPHTSYWDGFWGLLALKSLNIKYKTISAEWLFFWPMKYIMKYLLHAIPVGKKSANAIRLTVNEFRKSEKMHLVICPEGQLKPTDKWSYGCWFIAKNAGVSMNFIGIDYNHKKIIYLDSYQDVSEISKEDFMSKMHGIYKMFLDNGGEAKYPNNFQLPNNIN